MRRVVDFDGLDGVLSLPPELTAPPPSLAARASPTNGVTHGTSNGVAHDRADTGIFRPTEEWTNGVIRVGGAAAMPVKEVVEQDEPLPTVPREWISLIPAPAQTEPNSDSPKAETNKPRGGRQILLAVLALGLAALAGALWMKWNESTRAAPPPLIQVLPKNEPAPVVATPKPAAAIEPAPALASEPEPQPAAAPEPATPNPSPNANANAHAKLSLTRFPATFPFNAATPAEIDTTALEQLATRLKTCSRVILTGHSCTIGTPDAQHTIGLWRAQAVEKLLIDSGLAASVIEIQSAGSKAPEANNATVKGRQQNRRVTIACRGEKPPNPPKEKPHE